jgi:hypothetical protein
MHAGCVANVKRACADVFRARGRQKTEENLPLLMGMRQLSIACPPMLEAAFGYRGDMRYMAFHYSPRTASVVHSDGGDDFPVPNPAD